MYLFTFLFNLFLYLGISNIVQDHLITVVNKKTFQIDHSTIQEEDIFL